MNDIISDKYKNDVLKVLEYYVKPDDGIAMAVIRVFNLVLNKEAIIDLLNEMYRKDDKIYIHSINVAVLSTIVALKMNLDADSVLDVAIGSLIHDCGLIITEIEYYDIDMNELSIEDNFRFKKHTLFGNEKVDSSLSFVVKDIVLMHHEDKEGKGYPFKKIVDKIEVEIVSVCDAYEDMTSGIGYKVKTIKETVRYIRDNKDIKFNGKVVNIILEIIDIE